MASHFVEMCLVFLSYKQVRIITMVRPEAHTCSKQTIQLPSRGCSNSVDRAIDVSGRIEGGGLSIPSTSQPGLYHNTMVPPRLRRSETAMLPNSFLELSTQILPNVKSGKIIPSLRT